MDNILLTQNALAERWGIKPKTLAQWRWNGRGPKFLKIGGRALYRLRDIENFEAEHFSDSKLKK